MNKQLVKQYAVHGVFLALIGTVALQSRAMAGVDQSSLLYTLVSGEELIEGPLDPSAYAQTDTPGVGGNRLAAVDGSLSLDIITVDDAEVSFSSTLNGNVASAPLSPLEPVATTEETAEGTKVTEEKKPFVYTVEEGDTVAAIAEKFAIDANTILWTNGLTDSDVIRVGDHLTILPTPGVLHTVRSGDTLLAIASKYESDAKKIAAYNNLSDTHSIGIGQKLIIPGGKVAPQAAPRIVPRDTRLASREPDGPTPEPQQVTGTGMIRPVVGYVSQRFGQWGHSGVDIAGNAGETVYAAASGTVSFAGWLGAYGNLIIVDHGSGLQTYYAHNQKLYVGKGQAVGKGSAIAKVGTTGRSTGYHLHFELRKGGVPVNPCSAVSC